MRFSLWMLFATILAVGAWLSIFSESTSGESAFLILGGTLTVLGVVTKFGNPEKSNPRHFDS